LRRIPHYIFDAIIGYKIFFAVLSVFFKSFVRSFAGSG